MVASLMEAVAHETAVWVLKGDDRRRHEERRWLKKRDMMEMRKRKRKRPASEPVADTDGAGARRGGA